MAVMVENFRLFEAGPDPAGRTWQVRFMWQQNAISIRRADAVDVKFEISAGGRRERKVVALAQTDLIRLAAHLNRPLTDPWAARLAAAHLSKMIESDRDMDKSLVTPSFDELVECAR
jgi:hypothetical protein